MSVSIHYDPNHGRFVSADGETVAYMSWSANERDPSLGAKLAAGPDLLGAAKNLLKVLFDPDLRTEESMIDGADFVNQALALRAAIAKATTP